MSDINNTITRVVATPLPKGYYRYEATLADGSTVVIRAKATRRYANLFLWDKPVNHGASKGLPEYCTLGKAPGSQFWGKLLRTIAIEEGCPF